MLALDVYAYRLLLTARLISTQPIAARIIQMLRVVPNIALELLTPALFFAALSYATARHR